MSQYEESQNIGLSNLRKEDPGYLTIKSYNNDTFTLTNDEVLQGSIALYKDDVYSNITPSQFSELTESYFRKWLSLKPELVLIGTGDQHHFLSPEQMAYFYTKGVGVETMRTDSACRTHSVIAGEMRNALAILFPVSQ